MNEGAVFVCPLYTIAVFGGFILQANNVITIQFSCPIITLMIAFYLTKQIIETGDMVSILRTLMLAFATLIPFFLFCYFGGNITTRFEDIDNATYQLQWYNLPLDMQKDLLPLIALSQKRIYMRGYGNTRSTQSVFKKVCISNVRYTQMVVDSVILFEIFQALKSQFIYFLVARRL